MKEKKGNRAPDHTPYVGSDPMGLPQEGIHKEQVHLDREAVRRADERRARDEDEEEPKR